MQNEIYVAPQIIYEGYLEVQAGSPVDEVTGIFSDDTV